MAVDDLLDTSVSQGAGEDLEADPGGDNGAPADSLDTAVLNLTKVLDDLVTLSSTRSSARTWSSEMSGMVKRS